MQKIYEFLYLYLFQFWTHFSWKRLCLPLPAIYMPDEETVKQRKSCCIHIFKGPCWRLPPWFTDLFVLSVWNVFGCHKSRWCVNAAPTLDPSFWHVILTKACYLSQFVLWHRYLYSRITEHFWGDSATVISIGNKRL